MRRDEDRESKVRDCRGVRVSKGREWRWSIVAEVRRGGVRRGEVKEWILGKVMRGEVKGWILR